MMLASTNLLPVAALMVAQVSPGFGAINTDHSPVMMSAPARASQVGNTYSPHRSIEDRLVYVGSLGFGWDGGASAPISKRSIVAVEDAIERVRNLAPFERDPAVIPCADGSLQIEWHLSDSRFEMYFETDGSIGAWWHDRATNEEREGEGSEAYLLLGRWAVRDAAWPKLPIAA